MNLKTYESEIFAIRDNQKCGYDLAVDMFLNNIKDCDNPDDQHRYKGQDGFDYAALKPHYDALRANKQEYIDSYQPKRPRY